MAEGQGATRVVIMGAAGRDFHNFNRVYRDDPASEVVAFTAAQIPGIAGRRYPPVLAGPRYPDGIAIVDEADLERVCRERDVDLVVFAYSDTAHADVMHAGSRALAAGADFALLGPKRTMIASRRPVIAVSAVRTGCGKSQTSRWLSDYVGCKGFRVGVIRHPMPYGDLARQAVQRFTTRADLDAALCTIEEREEYEPHIAAGHPVFAGVDYDAIVALAERESDLIIWDGGNNDFPFVRPDLHIVLVDALRPDQTATHHPGETVLRMADVVVVAKANSATPSAVAQVEAAVRAVRPDVPIVRAASLVRLNNEAAVRGKRALIVEDGPTITHGGMATGAGFVAAKDLAAELLDPRAFAVPEIAAVYDRYPHIGPVLPAVGYSNAQLRALEATIAASPAEVVVAATPVDLAALVDVQIPVARVRYDFADAADPPLSQFVDAFLKTLPARA